MTNDRKVVSISSVAPLRQQSGPVRPGPLPALLAALRDRALTYLRVGLSELFDNADDNLFEKADRAPSNAEQSLFFDAMRLLRLQRQAVEKFCCDGLESEFFALQQGQPSTIHSQVAYNLDSLSLVQPDELEQTVALDGMVSRADGHNQAALANLTLRLNSLVTSAVTEISNPLAPAKLVQLFANSCAPLGLDIQVRLIVFKMFERHILSGINTLYTDANDLLINAGILPDLKSDGLSARSRHNRPSTHDRGPATGATADDQQVLALFSELLGTWRHASGDRALAGLGAPAAAPLQSAELLEMLSRLSVDQVQGHAVALGDVRGRIHTQLQQQHQQTGEWRQLGQMDDDVISLVSMLFDTVLDDQELPGALKALIGRMQLPILRVAIADKSFFNKPSHPARRLLNELARATLGWGDHDDLQRDQLHALLERMVDRMLVEQLVDAAFFEQMHDELVGFMLIEQRRAERLEQRVRDAEEGRARVDAAREQSARTLNELLTGQSLPVAVIELLKSTWHQVLQMTFLREGPDSTAWLEAVGTAELLIHSMQPLTEQDSIGQRAALGEQVHQRLCDGLRLIGEENPERSPLLNMLTELRQAIVVQQLPSEPATESVLPADNTPPAQTVQSTPVAEQQLQPESDSAQGQPEVPTLTDRVWITEPVLETEEPAADCNIEDLPDASAAAWVAGLHTGSWFDLAGTAEQPEQRCKLAAIISFSGKYIFVNRAGMKIAEFNSISLMQHYVQGLIRLVSDEQLFDRALESVIGNLRRLRDY